MAYKRFVHTKTSGEHQGIEFAISEDGKITLTHQHNEEYDEVVVPASLIFKLATILNATRKVHWIAEESKP